MFECSNYSKLRTVKCCIVKTTGKLISIFCCDKLKLKVYNVNHFALYLKIHTHTNLHEYEIRDLKLRPASFQMTLSSM